MPPIERSYVTLEQHVCAVCTQTFDTGSLLLDRRLRKTFEHKTVTDWGLCPACQKLFDDGYVAIVEVDEQRSGFPTTVDNAYRLGRIAHLRRARAKEMCADLDDNAPLMWAGSEAMDALVSIAKELAEAKHGD